MNILNLSSEQLRSMTRAEIRTAINDYFQAMTKREMILWLLETYIIQDTPKDTFENGQIVRRVEYFRDIETGAKVKGKITTWSYYPGGEIDKIKIIDLDSSDLELETLEIKHYLDGKQPTHERRTMIPRQETTLIRSEETPQSESEILDEESFQYQESEIVQDSSTVSEPQESENQNIFNRIVEFIQGIFRLS